MPSDAPRPSGAEGEGRLPEAPGPASPEVAKEKPETVALTSVVERPPPGLQRGKIGAPATLIAVLGGLALCVSITFYLRKSALGRAPRAR